MATKVEVIGCTIGGPYENKLLVKEYQLHPITKFECGGITRAGSMSLIGGL